MHFLFVESETGISLHLASEGSVSISHNSFSSHLLGDNSELNRHFVVWGVKVIAELQSPSDKLFLQTFLTLHVLVPSVSTKTHFESTSVTSISKQSFSVSGELFNSHFSFTLHLFSPASPES